MSVEVYLGNPPENIKTWIQAHSQPTGHPETRFTLEGGTVETYNITGTLDRQWMIDNNFWDETSESWLKTITQVDIGNTVTSIGERAFSYCYSLMSVTMPSVTSIREMVFYYCLGLTNITIGNDIQGIGSAAFHTQGDSITLTIGKTVAEVRAMGQTNYNYETNVPYSEWYLPSGSIIVCTDDTIPIY